MGTRIFFVMKSLICLLVLLYAVVAATGGIAENCWWYEQLGLSQLGVKSGKIWQFFSYALLHGNGYHLIVNTVLLWVLGGKLQSIVGAKKALFVLASGVVAGGVFQFALSFLVEAGESSLLVGVSGGILAMLLCLTTIDPHRVMRPLRIRAKHLGLGFLLSEAILTLIDPALAMPLLSGVGAHVANIFGESIFLVAHACHLGGAIAGLCIGREYRNKYENS
jgi:membrane associated rhomboid family serine protease